MDVNSTDNNNTNGNYSVSTNGTSLLDTSNYVIQGVLLTTIGVIGVCGNIACIIYFGRVRRRRTHFEAFMLWLAVCDNVFIVTAWLAYGAPTLSKVYVKYGISGYLIPWVVPIAQVATTGNIYLTIAISTERYIVICHPLFHHGRHKAISPYRYIIPIFIWALIYNASKFFELKTFYVAELEGILD